MKMYDYEKQHLRFIRESLAECTVLLKSNGDFPLESPCEIAAYGCGVRKTVKGGTGSGEVNSRYFINIEQGLSDAGFTVTTQKWLDGYDLAYADARVHFRKRLKSEAKAKKVNAVVYAMGKVMPEPDYDLPMDGTGDVSIYVLSRTSGEGNDREPVPGDIKLSATEKRDILYLNKKYPKFMLVINAGGVIDLSGVQEVKNILILSQLGVETGSALADILLGKQNPSGKLTTTWSAWEDYFPMEDFGDLNDTRYREGIYVGYRYFDSVGKKALCPFGYGLSYTHFSIDECAVTIQGDRVTVTSTVTNTGKCPGKEVLQVYVSAPAGKLCKPYQDLAGFTKTKELSSGASETVTVGFSMRDLASYDEEASAWVLERGEYIIRVGNSSVDTHTAAVVVLDRTVIVEYAKNVCGKPDYQDWHPGSRRENADTSLAPKLLMDADAIVSSHVSYNKAYEVDDYVKTLTDEQLIYANIGEFSGSMSIIGAASKQIAGAAGESTSKIPGMPTMIMADGPAGLRLSQKFYRDSKGAHAVDQASMPESVTEFMPAPLLMVSKLLTGKSKLPKGAVEEYQYATALPIGTALAQSWNLDLAKQCGDIVGDEMERFGIHFWLAPALNIHRSVRCGRNFEYYSEDPLLSGRMAAAITLGVQGHSGRGTTIKHFCANNQETNRSGSNSIVSERALREIYLKGFGICVKESQPLAVMTSYNLLNGTRTAESRDLCENILRCEFGFQGIVMTDWLVGNGAMNSKSDKYPPVKQQLVAAAGGDLFMPGCTADYKNMLAGLKDGSLSRQQLEINVTRVYRMAKKLRKNADGNR